ncbi:MAG: hypothetical protein Tsb002_32970 [Wenzhouxiangellaceae bacterium]
MQPTITTLPPIRVVGLCENSTFASHNPAALWQRFMPRRHEIQQRVGDDYFAIRVFSSQIFTPDTSFEHWAAVAVSDDQEAPAGMQAHTLTGGEYAVFEHRGAPAALGQTLQHIFSDWLPQSGYQLDQREHFERMPADYRPDDPQALETVWIPVRRNEPPAA